MLLGDFVNEVTTKLGIKSCIPCKARQAHMNQTHLDMQKKVKEFLAKFSSGSSGSGPQPGS